MIGVPLAQPVLITDRFNAQVILSREEKTYEKTLGSHFVFGLDAELDSENFYVKGNFAASINEGFKVTGTHLIIQAFGYTAPAQQFVKLPEGPFLGDHVRADGRSCLSKFFDTGAGPLVEYLFLPHGKLLPEEQGYSCRVGFVIGGEALLHHEPKASILSAGTAFILQRYEMYHFQTNENPLGVLFFNCDPRAYPKKGPSW